MHTINVRITLRDLNESWMEASESNADLFDILAHTKGGKDILEIHQICAGVHLAVFEST